MSTPIKIQRKTRNLGYNTAKELDDVYSAIELKTPTAKCTDGMHEGDRILPVRMFYQRKNGKGVQGACIVCQKNRRANRIKRAREKYAGKTKEEIYAMYAAEYGATKTCSKCKTEKAPSEFSLSISMECGIHNECQVCVLEKSQGNGQLRDYIFMPDKDGKKYKKKGACELCNGTDKLAVDHILPIAKGGTDCINNKQTLCVHCNSKKSDTICGQVSIAQLSRRYHDECLDFSDNTKLSQQLGKRVYAFQKSTFIDMSLDAIKDTIADYRRDNNMGHNLGRIIGKIAILFNKS